MEAELMPVVNADDLKTVFDFYRPMRLECGKHGAFSVPPERVQAICSPGADVAAISTRETFLSLFLQHAASPA